MTLTAEQSTGLKGAAQAAGRTRRERIAVRFAGDSGDGMQVAGSQFTSTTAMLGNDLATLPDFPAEIRAPTGTLAGVSGFQIQFGSLEILTPGDRPDALVAMNPAALKANLRDLERGAIIIANEDAFDARACEKVGLTAAPLDDGTLDAFRVLKVPIETLTLAALSASTLSSRDKDRCKNFTALGLVYWMFGRPLEHTLQWIKAKFPKPELEEANRLALQAGYHYGETTEAFASPYEVAPAKIAPGRYRQITGNQALAWGFIAASQQSGLDLFYGSYPITPASDVLHELARHKRFGVKTFQAEDEIAAICSAIGAAFGGSIGLTATSGPGLALKIEALGLAVMTELPLVVCCVQRGGPSTGLPTKTEQADLFIAVHGRNGEAPVPVIAAATPGDCFAMALEAVRIAVKYMTPVILLTDGYLANGAEPWRIPAVADLPEIAPGFRTDPVGFKAYARDAETLARPWVRPGTPGLEHRIGGLEKADGSGNVSYDPQNHEKMIQLRAAKVDGIVADIPDAEVYGPPSGDVLLVGWGGTYGSLRAAAVELEARGVSVGHMHLRHLHPMSKNVGPTMAAYKKVVCCELNSGQLRQLLRARFLVDVQGINKVQGQPFKVREIVDAIVADNDKSLSATSENDQ
ncbi:MAG: 2-oxoacid:acceptor oxidoreductase subunit alpha [Myxococcota bacterium]